MRCTTQLPIAMVMFLTFIFVLAAYSLGSLKKEQSFVGIHLEHITSDNENLLDDCRDRIGSDHQTGFLPTSYGDQICDCYRMQCFTVKPIFYTPIR